MKKILLLIVSMAALGYAVYFIGKVVKNIFKFAELNQEVPATPYALRSGKQVVWNIRTGKPDTLQTHGPMIVNLWATWCNPCLEEMPDLQRLSHELKDIPVILLTFDSLALQPGNLQRLPVSLPVYYIQDTSVISQPALLPSTLLVKNDSVRHAFYGEQTWMDSAIIDQIRKTFY